MIFDMCDDPNFGVQVGRYCVLKGRALAGPRTRNPKLARAMAVPAPEGQALLGACCQGGLIRAEHVQAWSGQVDADFGAGLDDF